MKRHISFIFLLFVPSLLFAGDLPSFKVVGQDLTAISILVPPTTSTGQLKALIHEFRRARQSNTLSKMIPATTKGGDMGDYAIVLIFVFSDPQWASADNLKKYYKLNMRNPTDKAFNKKYGSNIRAEYAYSLLEEYGSVGFSDGIVRTKNYLKLF